MGYIAEKIQDGECLDVRAIGKPIGGGKYLLRGFVEAIDYADKQDERWIHSIGRNKRSGNVIASIGYDLYQNPRYESLWLR